MIRLKSSGEIAILRQAGQRLAEIIKALAAAVKPGVSGEDLEVMARELIARSGDQPSFLNYQPSGATKPYPAALCVSLNNEVVHGLPSDRKFKPGDLVSLDLGLTRQGLFVDMAVTVVLEPVVQETQKLVAGTKTALTAALRAARPGARLGDIGAAIERTAKEFGLGLVRELGGHGVGFAVHEDPMIPNFGKAGQGMELKPGLVLAIEPMFTLGTGKVKFSRDEFVVKTADQTLAAHFEETVLITEKGVEVLTGF